MKDFILLEPGGIHQAVFGLFGCNSDDCAFNSGMLLEHPAEDAQRTVEPAEQINRYDTGEPVKEWHAIAAYLRDVDGEMDSQHAVSDRRKLGYSSLKPVKLPRNANKFRRLLLILKSYEIVRLVRRRTHKNRK